MAILNHFEKLFKVRPSAFGCDISDHSIRLAYLKEERGSLTLAGFSAVTLQEGAVVNGTITDVPKTIAALQEALTTAKGGSIRTKYVMASLPEPQSFIRIVQLPKMASEEITQAIIWEIEANIPLPLAEVYYDWEIARHSGDDHLDILVAASPKVLVDSYAALFEKVGLKPVAFEVDALSSARSIVPPTGGEEILLIIDVAHHRTTFIIYAGSMVRFTASVSIAGKDITSSSMGVTIKALAGYARQYIDFFQTHSAHAHQLHVEVKQILVCGDFVQTPGFTAALAQEAEIAVLLANPWVNILRPPLREVPMLPFKDSLGYTTALGLALRGYHEFGGAH
ncbi:MAG: pilus assembly protein PilM [bacterium]|nr:pilus assembly protein PilM [bacterium]